MAETKKEISIKLQTKEIFFDVSNKTYLTGQAREADGKKNFESAALMKVSEDNDAAYQVKRSISDAIASLKVRLGEYLQDDKDSTNNQIIQAVDNLDEVTLTFEMPTNFNNAAVDSLGAGCHRYVRDKSIFDWFVITNPEEAANYQNLAEEALETARRALYKRARPTRPTYGS